MLLACVAIGLLGYVAGGGTRPAPGTTAVAPAFAAVQAVARAGMTLNVAATAMLCMAGGLLLAAFGMLLRAERAREQSGARDPLTGLCTEAYLAEVLPGLVARDDRAGRSQLALIRVAIDLIEDVQRRYGRQAADLVLGSIGRHIRSQTREGDLAACLDREGFAIYLHCSEVEQAKAFCRRLGSLLASEQWDWRGGIIKVTASMGIALREPAEPIRALQARALLSLGEAQRSAGVQIVG